MFILFFLIALGMTTCHAEIVTLEEMAMAANDINEGNPCEAKIVPMINKIKSETDAKLGALAQNVEQILQTVKSKNRVTDNIPDKLEAYLDRKFDLLIRLLFDENTSRKLAELESKIAKIETVMDSRYNEQQKSISALEYNTIQNNKPANTTCNKIERDMISKLDTIQKDMQNFGHLSTQCQTDVIDKKLDGLEENINKKWKTLEKVIHNVENVTCNLEDKSKASELTKKNLFEETKKEKLTYCKERITNGSNFEPMVWLGEIFNHVLLTNDSTGVTYFEMRIAAKAEGEATILLSTISNPKSSDPVYEIDMEGQDSDYTHLRLNLWGAPYTYVVSPHIISRTHYSIYTIRISEGKQLEFLQNTFEGEKLILSYTDSDLSSVKYMGFSSWFVNHTSWFLYDCPAW